MKTLKLALALAISAALSTGAMAATENKLMCIKKNGQIRVSKKTTCKKKETAAVVATAPLGSSPGGQSVKDANGQDLGVLFYGGEQGVAVFNKATNTLTRLYPDPYDPSMLRPDTWNTQAYRFATADCSGTPLRVFQVDGDGSITPNGLGFDGSREIFTIIWAEANSNTTTGHEDLTGKYLTLGGLVDKQVNADKTKSVDATNALVNSRFGSYTWIVDDTYYYNGYWKWQPTGCTAWTQKTYPEQPVYTPNGYIYKGVVYPDWESAQKPYDYDARNYNDFSGYNRVYSESTRWVFNYADAPAPLAPVKLPLQFP